METWKNVNGLYEVSNNGTVRNLKTGRTLMPYKDSGCNVQVGIYNGKGKRVKTFVHKLVAKAFVPNPNNYKNVHHLDGNPLNNKAENLMWVEKPMYSPWSMVFDGKTKVAKCNPVTKHVVRYYSLDELANNGYNPKFVLACCKTRKNKFRTYRAFYWKFDTIYANCIGFKWFE